MIFFSIIREEGEPARTLLHAWAQPKDGHREAKPRSAIARALALDLVAAVPGGADRQWQLRRQADGRPVLWEGTPGGTAGLDLSISHSRGWIACAITSAGRVGLDLEAARPGRPWPEIADAAFGPAEIQRAKQEGEPGFYRIWTLREAIAKASGRGLEEVTDRRDRVAEGPGAGVWSCDLEGDPWQLIHYRPAGLFNLAIALKCNDRARKQPVELKWWHLPPELRNILPCESMR